MPRLSASTATRILWLTVAAVGGLLAWPPSGVSGLGAAILVVVLACATALPVFVPPKPNPRVRWFSTLGLLGLTARSILLRPTEPDLGLVVLVATAGVLLHLWMPPRDQAPPSILLTMLAGALAVAVPDHLPVPPVFPELLLLGLAGSALFVRTSRDELHGLDSFADYLLVSPARVLVVVFGVLCSAGTLLLLLPTASTSPGAISVIDAAFTAVSAICVTGLIVLDTPVDFTGLGQAILLVLIQVGGLGIMAFASLAVLTLGQRLGVREERLTAQLIGGDDARRNFDSALWVVLKVTFISEGLGAVLLSVLFWLDGDSFGMGLWRGVFTSISAFCNAGFALQSDSLVPYADQPLVLLVVSALIVVGGTGPVVVAGLVGRQRLNLHMRLVVWSTAVLIVVPALLFLAFEWGGVFAGMSLIDKATNAWFQSITLRTAGFNSVDFGAIRPESWTLSVVCMFVGASPGSTGGGIKTTTISVILLSVLSTIRGQTETRAFGRRIGSRIIHEASAIAALGVMSVVGSLMAIQLTQSIPLDQALFEVVSALGTAGISMGATGALDDVGKIVIIGCMFAGRVGPLTLFIFLVGRTHAGHPVPDAPVQVG